MAETSSVIPNPKSFFTARAFYFLYYGAWAFLLPFLVLYYQELGFSGAQIGLLASISPLVSMIAAPFWGGLADATRSHRRVLLLVMLGTGISVFALSQVRVFWLIVPIVASYAFFSSTIMPLVDTSVLAMLGERRDLYGSQRLWGAVGWGVAGPIAGWLTGRYGIHWAFTGYLIILAIGFLSARALPIASAPARQRFWGGVRRLIAQRQLIIFLLIVWVSGAGLSMVSNYLFLYMDALNASRTIMGMALAAATISEIPVLMYSGWMLRRWGPGGMMVLSLGAYVIRAYAYSAATEPWQVLVIQLLHGLTFSTMWVAGVSFAADIAPAGLTATAQGLFTSTAMGMGGITGSLIGGMMLDSIGASRMYFWSGSAVLLALVFFLMTNRKMLRRNAAGA